MAETTYTDVTWTSGDTITEAKMDSMVANDRAVDAMSNGVEFTERAAPSTPAANKIHMYAKDDGGYSKIYAIDPDGMDYPLATPTGSMTIWTTDIAPTGWALCYGQAISRTSFAELFTIIGTTYGSGDGSTTFNVPDMRGRFPLGQDDMGGTGADRVTNAQADSLGGSEGAETHALTTSELPSHNHTLPDSKDGTGGSYYQSSGANVSTSGITTGSTGSDTAHENMPPYLTLNYIIKT